MMKIGLSEQERLLELVRRRMDRFDAVVNEHLRAYNETTRCFAEKIGCDPSSLWRYRNDVKAFMRMPTSVLSASLRLINVSNEDLRYILGLPMGKADDSWRSELR